MKESVKNNNSNKTKRTKIKNTLGVKIKRGIEDVHLNDEANRYNEDKYERQEFKD